MIVCVCRGLSDGVIRAVIEAGAATPREVAAACGAGSDCGICRSMVKDLTEHARATICSEAGTSPSVAAGDLR